MQTKVPAAAVYDLIDGLRLPPFSSYRDADDRPLELLRPLSCVNIFVGENNTGKSLFLRFLAKEQQYNVDLKYSSSLSRELEERYTEALHVVQRFNPPNRMGNKQTPEILGAIRSLAVNTVSLDNDHFSQAREIFGSWHSPENTNPNNSNYYRDTEVNKVIHPLIEYAKESLSKLPKFSDKTVPRRIYVPTLRGLRRLDETHRDYYSETTKKSYFENTSTSDGTSDQEKKDLLEIYTGLSFFERIRSLRLGKLADRRRLDGYESFLANTFYSGQSVELM